MDLVLEVRTEAIILGNMRARYESESADGTGPFIPTGATKEDLDRLRFAEESYRDLGAKLQAFAKTEKLATWALRLFGLKLKEAGVALLALSNTLGVYGQERRNSMAHLKQLRA